MSFLGQPGHQPNPESARRGSESVHDSRRAIRETAAEAAGAAILNMYPEIEQAEQAASTLMAVPPVAPEFPPMMPPQGTHDAAQAA
jgi:alkylated DNA repair dioxygenase AlkB